MKIQIEKKSTWGRDLFYPIGKTAKNFAIIADSKTLTLSDLKIIKELGFEIEFVITTKYGVIQLPYTNAKLEEILTV